MTCDIIIINEKYFSTDPWDLVLCLLSHYQLLFLPQPTIDNIIQWTDKTILTWSDGDDDDGGGAYAKCRPEATSKDCSSPTLAPTTLIPTQYNHYIIMSTLQR